MTKHFCDVCGREIVEPHPHLEEKLGPVRIHGRWSGGRGRLWFEVITGLDGKWNSGVFCLDCIRQAMEERKGKA